ncbi:MAG: FecR domain-containing protein, partial [Endomicrobiia bacterium]
MKKLAFFCLIFVLSTLLFSLLFAEQKAIIQKLSGKVEIFSMGRWKAAKVGDVISSNQKIKTSRIGYCIILLQDGHTVRISGGSEVSVFSLLSEKTEFHLTTGRIRSKVSKLISGRSFSVRTPTAVCSVRGTDFAVEYEQGVTKLEVYEGIVSAKEEITGKEIVVNPGEFTTIVPEQEPAPPKEIPEEDKQIKHQEDIEAEAKEEPKDELKSEAQREIFQEISREQVMERAAEEIKMAEYQNGKSIIDVFGNRVRIEEYIVRPQPNQFKYVVLNTREKRFDFGKILFTFNKNLPTDLREATKNMFEYYGSQKPEYILIEADSVLSNTVDQINEHATGGDMFTDNPANPSYWRHYFTNYNFYLNNNLRWKYEATVSGDRITKIKFSYFDKNGNSISAPNSSFEMPTGLDAFHFREKNTYSDGVWLARETYVIDDNGKIITVGDLKEWNSTEVAQKAS